MRELVFRQPRRRLVLVVGLLYLAVLLIVAFVFFDQAAALVNDLASGGIQATGFVVAAVCLSPLLVLLVLATQKTTVRQDASTLTIRAGRAETVVPRRDIRRVQASEPPAVPIRRLAANGDRIAELNPRMQDYARVLALLTEDGAYTAVERHEAFRGRVTVVSYERR